MSKDGLQPFGGVGGKEGRDGGFDDSRLRDAAPERQRLDLLQQFRLEIDVHAGFGLHGQPCYSSMPSAGSIAACRATDVT